MSLNWSLTDIENYKEVCWRPLPEGTDKEAFLDNPWATYTEDEKTGEIRTINPVTDALVWLMLSLGCSGKITKRNVNVVIEQMAILQYVDGPCLRRRVKGTKNEWEDRYISAEDIRQHVGLATNCFGKNNTKRAFKERMWKRLREKAVDWLEKKTAEPSEEAA